jgi:hypothetical protein
MKRVGIAEFKSHLSEHLRFPAMRFATHDTDLAAGALAEGLAVIGV